MLDIDATRQNFNAWVRSPAFDAHFNSIAKAPVWPFIVAPLLILSLVGIPFGIGLLIYGHSIPNGNPPEPFAPGCPFTGVVLSPPWTGGEGFATLYLIDGTPVHFWSVVPSTPPRSTSS